MQSDYWQRQTTGKPLFDSLLWSRPENRQHAGKLLVVGGNLHGFAAPAEAYAESQKAGIGVTRVILPDALRRTFGKTFMEGEFAPSAPSGSFSRKALAELLATSGWADGVLVAGDLGRNSETAIMLEQFVQKYSGQLTLTKDAVDYFTANPLVLRERSDTCLVLSFAQLQKLAIQLRFATAFTFDMDMLRLVDALHEFTAAFPLAIVVKHLSSIFVACGGQVSTTKLDNDLEVWRVRTAAHCAVWWLQNPSKSFESLTTALVAK